MNEQTRYRIRKLIHLPGRALFAVAGMVAGSPCPVCGRKSMLRRRTILSDELVRAWELQPGWVRHFNDREGSYCARCGCNQRSRHHAAGLVQAWNRKLGLHHASLRTAVRDPAIRGLALAEINACGELHPWLSRLPGLAYSEYGGIPGVRREDLLALTYKDNAFDLVLTSETLEHVPDVGRALGEIHRVLKPGGIHVFTTPVVWDRPASRVCCRIENGTLRHLRPPSYHGMPGMRAGDMMVMTEFGADIVEQLSAAGFETEVLRDAANPAICTFLSTKPAPPENRP